MARRRRPIWPMGTEKCAVELGIAPATLRTMIVRGQISCIMVGRKPKIRREDLEVCEALCTDPEERLEWIEDVFGLKGGGG